MVSRQSDFLVCASVMYDYLLDGLIKTISAVWHHQSGSTWNHPVIIIKEVLQHRKRQH